VNLLPGTYNDIQKWSGEDIVGTELSSDNSLAPFAPYGENLVVGTSGRDRLFGGDDNDILVGGDRPDILVGRGGQDQLWGNEKDGTGSAQDIFVLDGSMTGEADQIMDYSGPGGDGDVIQLNDVLEDTEEVTDLTDLISVKSNGDVEVDGTDDNTADHDTKVAELEASTVDSGDKVTFDVVKDNGDTETVHVDVS
jgi:Ca2+-binding RTX toxin-like protein